MLYTGTVTSKKKRYFLPKIKEFMTNQKEISDNIWRYVLSSHDILFLFCFVLAYDILNAHCRKCVLIIHYTKCQHLHKSHVIWQGLKISTMSSNAHKLYETKVTSFI